MLSLNYPGARYRSVGCSRAKLRPSPSQARPLDTASHPFRNVGFGRTHHGFESSTRQPFLRPYFLGAIPLTLDGYADHACWNGY